MDIARRRETQAACELRAQVARDIAEKVGSDDHLELRRVAHHLHQQVINVLMAGLDSGVFRADFLEYALPQVVPKRQGIGFIGHAYALQAAFFRKLECIANDALDALARVEVLLYGNFVGSSLLEVSTHAHVQAFGVLAKNHEVHVFFSAVFQRSEALVEQHTGPRVDVEIELETQSQQNFRGVNIRGDARITHRTQQNGVEIAPKHYYGVRRQRGAIAQIAVRAPIKFCKRDFPAARRSCSLQNFHSFRNYFFSDAVTRNYGDALARAGGIC